MPFEVVTVHGGYQDQRETRESKIEITEELVGELENLNQEQILQRLTPIIEKYYSLRSISTTMCKKIIVSYDGRLD